MHSLTVIKLHTKEKNHLNPPSVQIASRVSLKLFGAKKCEARRKSFLYYRAVCGLLHSRDGMQISYLQQLPGE